MIRRNKPPKKKEFKIIRNKPPKNKRPDWEVEVERNLPEKNLGGHLPHPPEDCERPEFVRRFSNAPWIDLSCCHKCKRKKECRERKNYLRYLKVTRKRALAPKPKEKKK